MKLEILTSTADMAKMYPLIRQLNPKMTRKYYLQALKAIVKQGGYFQVAYMIGKKCVGVSGVWIGTQIWCGKFIEVDNFVIDKKFRGQGIGNNLLAWIEAFGRSQKCEMIRLDSYVTSPDAHRFYFQNGFRIQGFHMTKKYL